jgi:hypothetical protein
MNARRLTLLCNATLLGSAAISQGGPGTDRPPGTIQLHGAGATFPAPLYKNWPEECGWAQVSARREIIIVTGSSGLIGSVVVRRFSAHFDIRGFDRDGPPHPPPAEYVCMALTSRRGGQDGCRH